MYTDTAECKSDYCLFFFLPPPSFLLSASFNSQAQNTKRLAHQSDFSHLRAKPWPKHTGKSLNPFLLSLHRRRSRAGPRLACINAPRLISSSDVNMLEQSQQAFAKILLPKTQAETDQDLHTLVAFNI